MTGFVCILSFLCGKLISMADIVSKTRTISSLAAPTREDIDIWNALPDEERLAIIQALADEAAASKTLKKNARDIIKAAKAELEHG